MSKGTSRKPYCILTVAALLASLISLVSAVHADPAAQVNINEIRIDQTGTDVDEYFELAGPAGTSLDDLTYLVIGDGVGGSGVIEAVVDLTGQSIQPSGYVVAAESTFTLGTADLTTDLGFENGDNVTHLLVSDFSGALYDDLDTDDDGTLDATPWSELVDCVALVQDLGSGDQVYCATTVGPDGPYVPGHAFFCPEGWQIGAFDPSGGDDTPGADNPCEAEVPEVIINEIMQNPAAVADSNGEWFELYNPTASAIDIDGWTIKDEGVDEHVIDNGGPLEIPAGGFLVLGNNADTGSNGGVAVDYAYGLDCSLFNADDKVVLLDDSLTEIDRVEYDGGIEFPSPNGASMALQDPALDNNVGDNWCVASTPYGDGDLGTPGAANDCTAPIGDWVINEILADPSLGAAGDANGDGTRDGSADEFVEIVNNSDAAADISGWTLSDSSGLRHTFPDGTVVNPNCVVVVFGGGTFSGTFGAGVVQTATVGYLGLNNGGDTVTLNDGSTDRATVTYGAEADNDQSITRDPDVTGTFVEHATATGSGGALFSPGTQIDGTSFFGCTCGQAATLIHHIQGSGGTSPEDGNVHTIEGVVVGDFQRTVEDGYLSGFFVQEEPADWDMNDATSEGIFVYEGGSSLFDVVVGDKVRLTGEVDEYNTVTQIKNLAAMTRCSAGHTTTPMAITLPISPTEALEAHEGMLVTVPQELAIIEFYDFDRYGEIVLGTDRQYQPTALYDPDSPEAAQLPEQNRLSRIQLEDGRTSSNPDPAVHPNGLEFDLTNRFRGGDTVKSLTGVIDYGFGAYQLEPTAGAVYTATNPRPAAPEDVGGDLKVAAFNVLNFFTTLDTGADVCGPAGGQECRGANDAEEFTRQRDKLVAAMCAIDADVFGLIELENPNPSNDPDPGDDIENYVVEDLVGALNDPASPCPDKTYWFTDSPAIGTDPIRVDIIYKAETVTPMGRAVLTDTAFTDPNGLGDDQSRPAVAETFEDANGEALTVVVNHLKSKGTPCGAPDDDPVQGNCSDTRTKGAEALVDWLATDPTGSGDPDILIIGDLNAYAMEDPVAELTAGGYTDLVKKYQGDYAYSYVYDGQLGYLDYGLANEDLLPQVTGTTVWHINTDEPDILDYDTSYKQDAQDALYEPNPYRSSDHDPVIIGLQLTEYPYRVYLPVATKNYPQTFKLGILGPFTGPQYGTGDDFKRAVNIAFDAIDWRIGGYRIEPVWIDSASDSAKAADNYEEAILQDGVQAGLLNWHSSVAVSCIDVVADYQVPHFAGFGASETINDTFNSDRETYGYWTTKWWPATSKLNVSYVEALEHAINTGAWSPAARTVVISGEDTDWGHTFGDAIKSNFQAAGWTVLGEAYFTPGQTDFSAALGLLSMLNPAVVAGSSYSAESVFALLNQAHTAGLESVMIADGLEWMGDWYSQTGDASNYVLDQTLPGWITAEAHAFADAYQARYGTSPDPTSVGLAYDAANFFIAVAEATYQDAGELSSEALYEFVQEQVWTGLWSFTDGIMMPEYKYTDESIPDPVVGHGYYIFPILQYFDGEGKIIFPTAWADQPFTPPGS